MTAFIGTNDFPAKIYTKEMGYFDITVQAMAYSSIYLTPKVSCLRISYELL